MTLPHSPGAGRPPRAKLHGTRARARVLAPCAQGHRGGLENARTRSLDTRALARRLQQGQRLERRRPGVSGPLGQARRVPAPAPERDLQREPALRRGVRRARHLRIRLRRRPRARTFPASRRAAEPDRRTSSARTRAAICRKPESATASASARTAPTRQTAAETRAPAPTEPRAALAAPAVRVVQGRRVRAEAARVASRISMVARKRAESEHGAADGAAARPYTIACCAALPPP